MIGRQEGREAPERQRQRRRGGGRGVEAKAEAEEEEEGGGRRRRKEGRRTGASSKSRTFNTVEGKLHTQKRHPLF